MKKIVLPAILITSMVLLYHCRPDRIYYQDNDARLQFSLDTVYFDTIFTTVGTVTKSFRIYNPHKHFLKIDNISLAGGQNSVFSINVDGVPGYSFENYDIAPNDSMYVFVEAKLNPNESLDILRIQDSVVFTLNGNIQDIDLVAWGQDVHLIRDSVLAPNTVWTADKPYLVIDYMRVDSLEELSIEEGVQVYLHRDAVIHVKGTLKSKGSRENPIEFKGDRLEKDYEDIPGQWGFIFFENGSTNNIFDYTNIYNGTIGLYVNSPIYESDPVLTISNSEIKNMSYDGIIGMGTSIQAYNTIIGDCGNSCIELLYEGSYRFNHCTFANYWQTWQSNRKAPAVHLANYLIYNDDDDSIIIDSKNISEASFTNCIIYGFRDNELLISKSNAGLLNYTFNHVLAKFNENDVLTNLDESPYSYQNDENFIGIIHNEDPLFDSLRVSYELDSLSPAINAGSIDLAIEHPYDKKGESRISDLAPDLGALEKIQQ